MPQPPLMLAVVLAAAVAVTLCMAPAAVTAITFLSQTNPIEVINGVPRSAPKRVIRCTQADYGSTLTFQILDDSDILHSVTLTCNQATRRYSLFPYGLVPETGRLLRSVTSVSRSSARYLDVNGTDPGVVPSEDPTNPVLMSDTITPCLTDGFDRTCQMINFFTYPNIAVRLKITQTGRIGDSASHADFGASGLDNPGFDPDGHPGWGELAAAYCIGQHSEIGPTPANAATYPSNYDGSGTVRITTLYAESANISCYRGVNPAQYAMVQQQVNSTLNQFVQYGASQALVQLQTNNLISNITTLQRDLTNYILQANVTYGTLKARADEEYGMAQTLQNDAVLELTQRSDTISNITARLQASARFMAQSINQTSTALEQLLLKSANNKIVATGLQQQLLQVAMDNIRFITQQTRSGVKGISDFTGLMSRAANNEDVVNAQASWVQHALIEPSIYLTPDGTATMLPFTDNVGVQPVQNENDLGPISTVTVTNTEFREVIVENGQLYAVISRMTQNCSSAFLVGNSAPYSPTATEALKYNGPIGCRANYNVSVDPTQRCKCFVTMTEQRCHLLGPQYVNAWYASGSVQDGCIANYAPWIGSINRILYTVLDIGAAFANMTARGPPPFGNPIRITGRSGMVVDADWDPALLDTRLLWRNLMGLNTNQTSQGNVTLVNMAFSYAQELEVSFHTTMLNIESLRILIKGTPANRMTQEERLFTRYAIGDSGPTTIFSMMLYKHTFMSLMNIVLNSIEASVDVSVDGAPSTRITDVTLSNTQDNLLQQSSMFAMVIDPNQPMSRQFDIPGLAISRSAYAGARENHVDYARTPDADSFTMTQWLQRESNVPFKHTAADHMVSWYSVDVDTNTSSVTYGRCAGALPVYAGEWCLRRQHFAVDITGPFNDNSNPGSLVLRDYDSYLDVQVALPYGDVIITTGSRCPDVQQLAVSGETLLVLLVNAQSTSNRFQIQQIGACNTTEIVTLAPGGQYTKTASRCPSAPDDTPDVLVFSYTGSSGEWIPCTSNTITLAYQPQTVSAFPGAATLDAVLTVTSNRVDGLLLAIHSAEMAQLAALDQQLVNSYSVEVSLGGKVDTAALDFTNQARDTIAQLAALAAAQTAAARANYTQYITDKLISDFVDRVNLLREQFLTAYAKSQTLLQTYLSAYSDTKASYDVLTQFLSKNRDDAAQLVQAFGALSISIATALADLVLVAPEILSVASNPSSWSQVADLIVGNNGILNGLIGLFIKNPLSWLNNMLDFAGGSIRGLFVWLVSATLLVCAVIGLVITGLDIRNFFCQRSGSKADTAALAEINNKIPVV